MLRRSAFLAVAAATLAIAAPAFAHNEINPSTITPNKPTYLMLSAPNEGEADLVKIRIEAPEGLPLGELTSAPTGWTAEGDESIKTFSGGKLGPAQYAQFGIETEGAPQPGDFEVKVTETFSDGSSEDGTVVVTVAAPGDTPTTSPTETSGETSGGNQASASVKDDDGAASTALVVGIVAAVLALAALGLALSKGKRAAAPAEKSEW